MNDDSFLTKYIPNILIVDDVPANLHVLGDMLKREGYKVRPVPNGVLALQVAEKEKPDLVLLDIMMPGMDGYEVCRQLKENKNLCDIPIIFISALSEANDIVKALKTGGVDYITKPFRAEEVKARVSTHLKLYRQSQELVELNATKNKFFSIIAHDLKSPFHGFLGLTEVFAEDAGDFTTEQLSKFSKNMHKEAKNLYDLLRNLLEWAQMQKGSMEFEPKEFSISDLISKNVGVIEERSKQKGIEIVNLVTETTIVKADEKMINSALLNLLSNAIKFTSRDGSITINAKATANQMIEVSIADTGIGLEKKNVEKLFKMGEKIGAKGTDGELSTGLGLLLCKDFVEKNGGQIWVESEIGKGSIFYFTVKAVI